MTVCKVAIFSLNIVSTGAEEISTSLLSGMRNLSRASQLDFYNKRNDSGYNLSCTG